MSGLEQFGIFDVTIRPLGILFSRIPCLLNEQGLLATYGAAFKDPNLIEMRHGVRPVLQDSVSLTVELG